LGSLPRHDLITNQNPNRSADSLAELHIVVTPSTNTIEEVIVKSPFSK